MQYTGTLIAVKDMEKAKRFYLDVLGLKIVGDFGANVALTGGVFLQTAETWKTFIHKKDSEILFENNAAELYFEENDIDLFIKRLGTFNDISYIHPLIEHSWGQRAVRFYDSDNHIIEVAENINIVVRRFIDNGLSVEETAVRMDVPTDYITSCLIQHKDI